MSLDTFMAASQIGTAGAQIGTGIAGSVAAGKQASRARRAGKLESELERRKGRRLAGKQRAAFAKSGVLITEGTPLDVLAQTAADTELNALRAAFGFEQQAEDFESTGRGLLTKGILGAGQTILGSPELQDLFKRSTSTGLPTAVRGSPSNAAIRAAGRID